MRVGLHVGDWATSETEGGAFTFSASIVEALRRAATSHEWVVLRRPQSFVARVLRQGGLRSPSLGPVDPESPSQFVRATGRLVDALDRRWATRRYGSLLNRTALEERVDLVWFLTPSYEHVDAPFVLTVWDLQHRRQPFFPEVSAAGEFERRERMFEGAIRRAAFVIAGNDTGKDEIVRFYGYPEERVRTLELPTPAFAFDASAGATVDVASRFGVHAPYLVYPAQFWPHKNHVAILDALHVLHREGGPAFDVVFTGADKGNQRHVAEHAHRLGLTSRVHFAGFVSRDELAALYRGAFALAFPSYFGPNNLPPLEAAAFGCPVVCAAAPGMREQLGDAALFFDPRDPGALAGHLRALRADPAMRERLIERGRARAARWTSRDYVDGMLRILDEFEPVRRTWSDGVPFRPSQP